MVTLTTDFGAGSPYVATLKAVLLARCPDAVLVDVTHAVPPFDVRTAAFVLWAATRQFGPGAVHLAVIDPGVGTDRRRLAVRAGSAYYVAPDNGVLDRVVADSDSIEAVSLRLPEGASRTFEGRDVFAPAAAALASGSALSALGTGVSLPPPGEEAPAVLWVDAFGNLVTSLRPPVSSLAVGGTVVRRSALTYGEAPAGELFFYTGSLGLVEVALREARADLLLGAGPGTPVTPNP